LTVGKKQLFFVAAVLAVAVLAAGCDMGVVMGSRSVGVRSGEFVYSEGYMVSTYNDDFDRVWKAVEAVYREMKAQRLEQEKKIGKGKMVGFVLDEKLTVKIEFKAKDQTEVAVLVGLGGNNIAAHLIHEKIAQELSKDR